MMAALFGWPDVVRKGHLAAYEDTVALSRQFKRA